MRMCLIARNRFHNDRKAQAIYRVLQRAGNDVRVVAVDHGPPRDPVVATVNRLIGPDSRMTRRLNRILPPSTVEDTVVRRLARAAALTEADTYLPLQESVLHAAARAAVKTNGMVQRAPWMAEVGDLDLISIAPIDPERAAPVSGYGISFTPEDPRQGYDPEPGRHRGEQVVLCYRSTGANPGRYLESALERAGLEVRCETAAIDLTSVDPNSRFILFVEGPYPEIRVTGSTPVPTFYWVHHGEHHLYPNLRLMDRYRADAVLLAHSWHLAPWFPAPVHRFPFAVAPELFANPRPLQERNIDVAMVGSKLKTGAWQYRRRTELVEALESSLPAERVRFVSGVTPEEMAHVYGDSRIVINEGGLRHHPITMRVFEAVGAGSLLLTDPAPGLELIFAQDEYERMGNDIAAEVERLLTDINGAQATVDRALSRAAGEHTYDHRVDLLLDIAAETPKREIRVIAPRGEMARLIASDVEVQRVIQDGLDDLDEQLPDREVWALSERSGRLRPGSMDAAVITEETNDDLERFLDTARRYIYVQGDPAGLEAYLKVRHPEAVVEQHDGLRRIDLMTESYRVRSARKSS